MKRIVISRHARAQAEERGVAVSEVIYAVQSGAREAANKGRLRYKLDIPFNAVWNGKWFATKQVAPIVVEETDKQIVVTVYAYYF